MKYEMASVKPITLKNAGVHSLVQRGVNYLLTGIIKNLALHGKERLSRISRGVQYIGGIQ